MKTPFDCARSIRYAAFVTMICAASAVQACSSEAIPTAPASVSGTMPLSPEAIQLRVSGVVTDEAGAPVVGAKVIVAPWVGNGAPYAAITDNAGFYSISFLSAPGISVMPVKDGYESVWHSHEISARVDFKFDLLIRRLGT